MSSSHFLCELPWSVRFVTWSLRMAKLAAEGNPGASGRLHECYAFLERAPAKVAACRIAHLLRSHARRALDVRSPCCAELSADEVRLITGLAWLQAGRAGDAYAWVAQFLQAVALPAFMNAAQYWMCALREINVDLPHVELVSNETRGARTRPHSAGRVH